MANARYTAAAVLVRIEKDAAYSNIALNEALSSSGLSGEDRAFASALVYGVLDRRITLDYLLSRFMKTPIKKTAPFTLQVLRCALYQILYMQKVPESAAVNEAVKLIKRSKESRNAGFVNAVLRQLLRTENLLPDGQSSQELSVRYSCPEWIINSFVEDYGRENAIKLLEESLKAPDTVLRVNTTKISADELVKRLEDEGVPCRKGENGYSVILGRGMDLQSNDLFRQGLFFVQDTASQKTAEIIAPKPSERVLDICAAPGGKSFSMACLMQNKGEIVSCDLYPHRTELISKSAKRLGLDIIKPMVSDATVYNEALGEFDCVLCDVVCSGLGVIRRKPELKYKTDNDFDTLCETQLSILRNAAKYLKKGGRLLYSTCTLRREENEKLVIRFLMEYNNFCKKYEHTFMPHTDGTDGFYCALLQKGE